MFTIQDHSNHVTMFTTQDHNTKTKKWDFVGFKNVSPCHHVGRSKGSRTSGEGRTPCHQIWTSRGSKEGRAPSDLDKRRELREEEEQGGREPGHRNSGSTRRKKSRGSHRLVAGARGALGGGGKVGGVGRLVTGGGGALGGGAGQSPGGGVTWASEEG
jgi:hypothetical protein